MIAIGQSWRNQWLQSYQPSKRLLDHIPRYADLALYPYLGPKWGQGVARDTNETKLLKTWPNLVQHAYFDQLRRKGLYGNSKAEVLLRLADERLKQMLKDEEIDQEGAVE